MKLDYLNEKKELVSVVLLGVSVSLAVLILIKAASFFTASANAENQVKKALAQSKLDAKDQEKYFAESKAIADELKRDNLFAPPPPKQHPVREVPAILGDEVLINGKWYKAGEMVGDAKIVAIEPTQVKILWQGNEKIFAPISTGGASGPGGARRPGPPARGGAAGRAEMVVVGSGARPGRGERMGGSPPGGPDFGRGMRERWQNMSDAERERLRAEMRERRERFMNMSPEERERFRAEMRERFGGGPGRGPGGRR
jgi:hypothetical protein